MSGRPNLGNARCVRQIDCPGGLVVMAWRMNDGPGVVEIARIRPGATPDVLSVDEEMAAEAVYADPHGWSVVDLLQMREAPFAFSAADVTPLIHAMRQAVTALEDDPRPLTVEDGG